MGSAGKILVVEDNDFVRMQVVRFLNGEGYETAESSDGQEALDFLSQSAGEIGLAIVDVRMEPVGGFEFVRTIREENIKFPVVFVTGDDNPDLLSEASKCGVGTILKKPVQKDRLIKTVFRILRVDKQ